MDFFFLGGGEGGGVVYKILQINKKKPSRFLIKKRLPPLLPNTPTTTHMKWLSSVGDFSFLEFILMEFSVFRNINWLPRIKGPDPDPYYLSKIQRNFRRKVLYFVIFNDYFTDLPT
jgi:hypothetical protein